MSLPGKVLLHNQQRHGWWFPTCVSRMATKAQGRTGEAHRLADEDKIDLAMWCLNRQPLSSRCGDDKMKSRGYHSHRSTLCHFHPIALTPQIHHALSKGCPTNVRPTSRALVEGSQLTILSVGACTRLGHLLVDVADILVVGFPPCVLP